MKTHTSDRRPISARNSRISEHISSLLTKQGISPNAISIASMVFAAGAGGSLVATKYGNNDGIWWSCSIVLIIMRLLANMFDDMVAVESGRLSALGEIYNELPDRISDAGIFIAAGFASGSTPHLGYIAALLAVLVAYTRTLGNFMGVTQLFLGPMAKSHRMFTLSAFCLFNALLPDAWGISNLLSWGLLIIISGSVLTFLRRVRLIVITVQSHNG